jgi:hypothetical protein
LEIKSKKKNLINYLWCQYCSLTLYIFTIVTKILGFIHKLSHDILMNILKYVSCLNKC